VALWSRGRVLLVGHSYRSGWGMPGGGMARGEQPEATALRELREELGLVLSPRQLSLACVLEDDWMRRHETVHIFEAVLDEEPAITIDNREIVAAEFVAAEAATRRDLPPHVRQYLAWRSSTAPT
jgi:8-oxo-dGTP pyrophosphatase MutT (NUDIX family)